MGWDRRRSRPLNKETINMTLSWRALLGAAFVVVLVGGCGTAPPGAGFTSGDKPTLTSDEKPAIRDDLPAPENPDSGDAALAGSAATLPASGDRSGEPRGEGARPSGAQEKAGANGPTPEVKATPPTVESPADPGAQGATRPSDDVKVGTPRSPQ